METLLPENGIMFQQERKGQLHWRDTLYQILVGNNQVVEMHDINTLYMVATDTHVPVRCDLLCCVRSALTNN